MFQDDLRLVGVGPTLFVAQVLRDVSFLVDADYLDILRWAELTMRTNSANV